VAQRALGAIVTGNNARVRRRAIDRGQPNPRALQGCTWNDRLEALHPDLRAEWDAFVAAGGQLPRIEDLIAESQGNEGTWRAGLLVSRGRPIPALADRFPQTLSALEQVPHLWSALWSELEPGGELPEHVGPNAGMLRYHLGIDCGPAAGLRVGAVTTPYRDGRGILFDDTAPHAAWNHGERSRITLFLEVIRPVPGAAGLANRAVQSLLALDPRYRRAPARAAAWDRALNPPRLRIGPDRRP
jgi:beta-hydroxylase